MLAGTSWMVNGRTGKCDKRLKQGIISLTRFVLLRPRACVRQHPASYPLGASRLSMMNPSLVQQVRYMGYSKVGHEMQGLRSSVATTSDFIFSSQALNHNQLFSNQVLYTT